MVTVMPMAVIVIIVVVVDLPVMMIVVVMIVVVVMMVMMVMMIVVIVMIVVVMMIMVAVVVMSATGSCHQLQLLICQFNTETLARIGGHIEKAHVKAPFISLEWSHCMLRLVDPQ